MEIFFDRVGAGGSNDRSGAGGSNEGISTQADEDVYGANEDEIYLEDGSLVVKIMDKFEGVLQTVGMKKYFNTEKKRKHVSKSKQKGPLSIVMRRTG